MPISSLAAVKNGTFQSGQTLTLTQISGASNGTLNVTNFTGTYAAYDSSGTLTTYSDKTDWSSTITFSSSVNKVELKSNDSLGTYSYDDVSLSTSGTSPAPDPEPTEPDPGDDTTTNPIGGLNMFTSLTTSAITTEATSWANHFDSLLLVVVGVGVGFAAVRFVKSLFF